MAIELEVAALDSVDESLHSAYTETDGKFRLDADKYAELKAQGLKSKNRELLKSLNDMKPLKERAEKFKDVDDDTWSTFQEWKDRQGEGGGSGGGQSQQELERAIAKEKQRFEKQLKEAGESVNQRDARIGELEGRIREFNIWSPVRDLAAKAGVMPDRLDAFMTVLKVGERFDLDDGGKLVFKDRDKDPTTLTPEKAFQSQLKDEFAWAFAATGAGGSGAAQGQQGGSSGAVKISRADAKDALKYRAAMAEASKRGVQIVYTD